MSNRYSFSRTSWLRYSWLLLVAFLFSQGVMAQVSAYTFAQSLGTYADITGGTVLATGSAYDDNSYSVTLPFTFTFNGAGQTQVYVSSNGFITFGATDPTGTTYAPISSTLAYAGAVSAWGTDANGFTAIGGRTSEIRWETIGTAPNRIIVFQWKDTRSQYSTSATLVPYVNYQIRLFESNSQVQVMYGPSGLAAGTTNSNRTIQVGLRGAANTDFNNRTNPTTVLFGSSTAGTLNTSTQATASVTATPGRPANGLTYTWTAPNCFAPSGITATVATSSSLTYTWNAANPVPAQYQWELRTSGAAGSGPAGLATSGNGNVLTTTLTGLTANTQYFLYVRSDCGSGSFSSWSSAAGGFTGYCASTSTGSGSFFGNVVTTGGSSNLANNTAAWSATGYGDFTAQSAAITAGQTLSFTLNMTGTTVGVACWVDYNNNLIFETSERMFTSNGYVGSPYTAMSFVVPNTTPTGNYRMRLRMDFNSTNPGACGNITQGETEDYTLAVTGLPVCSGTPTGGTTTGGPGVCSGVSFTLNVTGATTGVLGLTYEWETSTNGTTWTPTGVTTLTYTSSITTSTWYRRRITCSGSDAWSSPLQLTINVPTQCYCTPTATYGCADGDVIARVQLNTLDNNSGTGCPSDPNPLDPSTTPNVQGPGYSDYTTNPALTTNLSAGGTYSCTVFAGQYSENYAVWIDYNDDGVFATPSERVGATTTAVTGSGSVGVLGSSASFPIVLACNPPLGVHRMRVRCVFGVANGAAILPCGNVSYGETEDYLITITTPVPCPAPTNLATANVTTTTADLSWTIGCAETVWAVEYGPQGFTPGTGIFVDDVFTNPYTLSGLLPATNYSVYIYAKCGPTLYSAPFGPVNFQTLIPPPTNDDCASALDLGGLTSPYTSTTVSLLANVTTVCGAPTAEDGVFYIDVPNNFILTIGQTSNSYDSEISVAYGGACPGVTQITCFDEPDIQNITFNNNTGSLQRVYWVQSGWITGAAGVYTLAWNLTPAPSCGAPTITNGVTTAFTQPFTVTPSVWGTPTGYEYQVGAPGFTPSGAGTAFTGTSATITGLTASTSYQYYVRANCGAGGFSPWAGPISFTTTPPPPANDDCSGAITINCASTPVVGTTLNATLDASYVPVGPNLGTNTTERGVWYKIVGDDQEYNITTCDPENLIGYDTRLSVYEGSCAGLIPLVANDDMNPVCSSGGSFRSRVVFSAFAGTDYYVFVHGYQFGTTLSATGNFELNITCSPACVPQTYNQCANAVALTPNITCVPQNFTTLCATPTAGLANPAGVSIFATYTDSWFTITPTTTDFYVQFTYGTASGLRYTFYSGVCGTLTQLAPNNLIVSGTEYGIFGATVGQTYYVRVGNDGNGVDGTFSACVRSLPCSTPTSATVTATSNTNVNVVINGGIAGDTYIIEYGPQGHVAGVAGTAGTGGTIVTTNTLNTNVPVAANQNYTFFVRKDCSGSAEGYSFNVGPYNVNTFTVVPTTGTQTLNTCNAVIYDSGTTNNYLVNNNGVLIVQPTSASALMTFTGTYDGIETCCDDLNIYQGAGTTGTLLGNFNGTGSINIQSTVPGGALTIQFLSDGSVQGIGFQITAQCQEVCTSLPVAMPVTGPTSVCLGENFTLSVGTPSIGYTYQWQRFTSSGWVNISGANAATYTGTQTSATTYRCRIGCIYMVNPASTTASQVRTITMNAPTTCYCTPASQSNTFGDYISSVQLGSINNATGANATAYTVYPATAGLTTTLLANGNYTINLAAGSWTSSNYLAAWIDFNRNGLYEPSEKLGQSGALGAFGTASFSFTVPGNASIGASRLRVREEYLTTDQDPCLDGGFNSGETEDYVVSLAPGSSNDQFSSASTVAPAVFPGCTNITGNLANATPTVGESGNDLWYTFTAASNAVRIQLTGAQDCELSVHNFAGAELVFEDATSSNGNEVLAVGSLVAGTQYWVRIHSMNANPTTFACCIQTLNDSRCDSGPTFTGLCSNFKVDWTGTGNYVARFTDLTDNAVYTHNFVSGTSVQLVNVPGLRHNRSYSVAVDAIYTVVDAGGNTSTVTATSNESCNITINQHPLVNLRNIDRDPATRAIGAFIATDIVVCGIVGWSWNFELVDASGNSIDINPGDNEVITNTTSRFIRTSQIPGVQPGDRYRVMVRPRFSYGPGVYDTASSFFLKIAGSANSVEVEEGVVVNPEEMYFERNTVSGASAAIYPNPNNGDMVNLNLAGMDSENVQIRIMDATGRLVWSNRYVVDGALNTIIAFDRPLPSGLYMVEMTYNNEVITERMMVTK